MRRFYRGCPEADQLAWWQVEGSGARHIAVARPTCIDDPLQITVDTTLTRNQYAGAPSALYDIYELLYEL